MNPLVESQPAVAAVSDRICAASARWNEYLSFKARAVGEYHDAVANWRERRKDAVDALEPPPSEPEPMSPIDDGDHQARLISRLREEEQLGEDRRAAIATCGDAISAAAEAEVAEALADAAEAVERLEHARRKAAVAQEAVYQVSVARKRQGAPRPTLDILGLIDAVNGRIDLLASPTSAPRTRI